MINYRFLVSALQQLSLITRRCSQRHLLNHLQLDNIDLITHSNIDIEKSDRINHVVRRNKEDS